MQAFRERASCHFQQFQVSEYLELANTCIPIEKVFIGFVLYHGIEALWTLSLSGNRALGKECQNLKDKAQ